MASKFSFREPPLPQPLSPHGLEATASTPAPGPAWAHKETGASPRLWSLEISSGESWFLDAAGTIRQRSHEGPSRGHA